jgi:hypothetical protein
MLKQQIRKYFKFTKYYILYYSKHKGLKYLFLIYKQSSARGNENSYKKYTSSQENVSVYHTGCGCWKEFKMINKSQTFFLSKKLQIKTEHAGKKTSSIPHTALKSGSRLRRSVKGSCR